MFGDPKLQFSLFVERERQYQFAMPMARCAADCGEIVNSGTFGNEKEEVVK
jgi:hypothetical protein